MRFSIPLFCVALALLSVCANSQPTDTPTDTPTHTPTDTPTSTPTPTDTPTDTPTHTPLPTFTPIPTPTGAIYNAVGRVEHPYGLTVIGATDTLRVEGSTSGIDHGDTDGREDDDHTQYTLRSHWGQNGFVDRADSTLAFDNGTRVFTVAPTGASFDYFVEGTSRTQVGSATVTLTDTEGYWIIYFTNADVLTAVNSPSHVAIEDLIDNQCWVSSIYYDADNNLGILEDERHGMITAPRTHRILHEAFRMLFVSGLGLGDFVISNGADDEDAQFSIDAGELYDEDLAFFTNVIAATQEINVYYRDGADWRWTTQTGFKCITFDGTDATRLAWCNNGTLTEVASNKFVLMHIFGTNAYDLNPIAIVGQNEYLTANTARDGAGVEMLALVLGALPSEEMKSIATVIFQTNLGYANSVNAKVVQTTSGGSYVDWRTSPLSGGAPAGDHDLLAGVAASLAHILLARLDGSLNFTGAQTFEQDVDIDGDLTPATITMGAVDIDGLGIGISGYTWEGGALDMFSLDLEENLTMASGQKATIEDIWAKDGDGIGLYTAGGMLVIHARDDENVYFPKSVGIGTAPPNAPLEVKGLYPGTVGGFPSGLLHVTTADNSEFANSVITGHNSYTGNTQLWYLGSTSNSNNDIAFINRQYGSLSLWTNDTERLKITKDGDVDIANNLSIGNGANDDDDFLYFDQGNEWFAWDNAPVGIFYLSESLDIAGDLLLDGGITMQTGQTATIEAIKAVDATGILIQDKDGLTSITVLDGGNVVFSYQVTAASAVMAIIQAVDGDGGVLNTDGGAPVFRWLDDGNAYVVNRLGVGTNVPGEEVEIQGDGIYLELNHPAADSYVGLKLSENGTFKGIMQKMGSTFSTAARRGDVEIWSEDGDVTLQKDGGNVGIGTTAPAKVLDVNGDISLEAGNGSYYSSDGSQGITTNYVIQVGATLVIKDGVITEVQPP